MPCRTPRVAQPGLGTVEDQNHLSSFRRKLKPLGCHYLAGFFFRPVILFSRGAFTLSRRFRGLRVEPNSSYDAVVIGAGVGGLVCATLLARASLKVLLVEQHSMVGGYCSTFRRGGYTFDAATHFYPLLGNKSTITGSLLSELGITTEWVKMDPVDRFHFPDGSAFAVPADFDSYLAKLKVEFPAESENIDRFFAKVRKA